MKAKFPVKIKDVYKIEKKNSIDISVFGYKDKEKYPLYTPKNTFKKHFDLFLLKKDKKCYVLIKDSNAYKYDYTLQVGRKHFFVIDYKL